MLLCSRIFCSCQTYPCGTELKILDFGANSQCVLAKHLNLCWMLLFLFFVEILQTEFLCFIHLSGDTFFTMIAILGSRGKKSSSSCCCRRCRNTNIRSHDYCPGSLENLRCARQFNAEQISCWQYHWHAIFLGMLHRCWWGTDERWVCQVVHDVGTRGRNMLASITSNNYSSPSKFEHLLQSYDSVHVSLQEFHNAYVH